MSAKIKVHVLHCGSARVDASLPFHEKNLNPISFTGIFRSNKHQVWLPVSAYLIEHPKGLVLIDTGWHTDVRVDQKKHLGLFHWIINKAALPEGEAIHEQLKQKGFAPSDIDYLVLSHLHADHVSGLKHVTGAKKILVSDIELKDATNNPMRYISSMWAGVNIETFRFEPSQYGPEKKSFDLFGDDSLIFVNTPGHTHGLAATIVKSGDKFLLLASDTGYAKKSWEKMILPGVQVDKKKVVSSLKWVKEMSEHKNCIEAIANHDTEMQPKIIEV